MVKQSRNRQRGKESEKEVAKLIGGKRIGILGHEDIFHERYSIEIKSRKTFVANKWMEQCIKNNKENKVPLVIVHEANKNHLNDFVIIKLSDFLEMEKK